MKKDKLVCLGTACAGKKLHKNEEAKQVHSALPKPTPTNKNHRTTSGRRPHLHLGTLIYELSLP
jgi:hypothetical protein